MRNIDETVISKNMWINKPILPLWVYATLRHDGQFHYYLVDCSTKVGDYQMGGTLMRMVSGDVFALKDSSGRMAPGELYRVSFVGLLRIFHLENKSGTFPKAYELDVSEVSDEINGKKDVALWFRRREEEPLQSQINNILMPNKTLMENLVDFFRESDSNLAQNDIDAYLRKELKIREQATNRYSVSNQ